MPRGIKITLLKCKLLQEGKVRDLKPIVCIKWKKNRQVCKIQCPLCYRPVPSVTPHFIYLFPSTMKIIVPRSMLPTTCFLKFGVSCFIVVYVLFASDRIVSFRDAWWKNNHKIPVYRPINYKISAKLKRILIGTSVSCLNHESELLHSPEWHRHGTKCR